MMNPKRFSVPRILTPVALAITLAACSSTPKAPTYIDITLEPSESVQSYMIKADSSQGNMQKDWLIMATKAALKTNQFDQADLLIKRLARQAMTERQQAEWQLARAELSLKQGNTSQAVELLNFKPWWNLADSQWKDYYQLKASAYQKLEQYFEANRQLSNLSRYASSGEQAQIAANIWANFQPYSEYQLTSFTTSSEEDVLDGWLQLAVYHKALAGNITQLKSTLENWLKENPSHPAAMYTPIELTNILNLEIVMPSKTALLLPLTGKYAAQGQLIRDGFIFAMMNNGERDPENTLSVIDTNSYEPDQIKQRLAEEQIDFIVGPLQKQNVELVQEALSEAESTTNKAIPFLALNIPNTIVPGTGICYLTLSPEQEVAQAAKHLFSKGIKYPMVLAPNSTFGQRVTNAFNDEWSKYSADKVAISYFGDKRQLQKNINEVFGMQESQQRIAQMTSLTGLDLETQARSRRDVDAVYIVAKNSELTLIKPFIEVAINPDATPPKLYANSRSNNGEQQFEDLSGVTFSDIPLLINGNPNVTEQMGQIWPGKSNVEKRLTALGMDAYTLIGELPQMKVAPNHQVQGQTGKLSIDEHCVIQREVSWSDSAAF